MSMPAALDHGVEALYEAIEDACRDAAYDLPRDQAYALSAYIGMGHVSINRVLRGLAEEDPCSLAQVPHLRAIKPLLAPCDLTVYRGARMDEAVKVGEIVDRAFVSTSLRLCVAEKFARGCPRDAHMEPNLMVIDVAAGTPLIPVWWMRVHSLSMPNPGFLSESAIKEAELMLMPGTSMIVESVEQDADGIYVSRCRVA